MWSRISLNRPSWRCVKLTQGPDRELKYWWPNTLTRPQKWIAIKTYICCGPNLNCLRCVTLSLIWDIFYLHRSAKPVLRLLHVKLVLSNDRGSVTHICVSKLCLFGTKPLSELMLPYYELDPWQQTSAKFEPIQQFTWKKMHLKIPSAKMAAIFSWL